MIMKNEDDGLHLEKLFKLSDKTIVPSHWHKSGEINKSIVASLALNEDFLADIDVIRKTLNIPKFKDFTSGKSWLEYELSKEGFRKLNDEIFGILRSYKLPLNFLGWILDWILLGEIPAWKPLYNNDSFELLEKQLVSGLPLTTDEKKWMKRAIRSFTKTELGIKNLPQNYKNVLRLIDAAKNTRRKFKNLERDLSIVSEMSKRRKAKTKNYIGYLGTVVKRLNPSKKEMGKLEKVNPQDIEIVKRYTSRDVAKNVGLVKKKSNGSYVRKRLERVQKRAIKK